MTDAEITQAIGCILLESEGIPTEGVTILSAKEYTYQEGYCETCYYETQKMRVRWIDADGETTEATFWATYSEVLQELLKRI